MAQYADMRHVRYDDEGFHVYGVYIRIFVSGCKTHVYGGQWIDIARPPNGSFDVFGALLLGKKVSGRGSIMAHIDAWTRRP